MGVGSGWLVAVGSIVLAGTAVSVGTAVAVGAGPVLVMLRVGSTAAVSTVTDGSVAAGWLQAASNSKIRRIPLTFI